MGTRFGFVSTFPPAGRVTLVSDVHQPMLATAQQVRRVSEME